MEQQPPRPAADPSRVLYLARAIADARGLSLTRWARDAGVSLSMVQRRLEAASRGGLVRDQYLNAILAAVGIYYVDALRIDPVPKGLGELAAALLEDGAAPDWSAPAHRPRARPIVRPRG